MVGVSPCLCSGTESGQVSLVPLEATRTAKLLPAELLAIEPVCSQSGASHAQTANSGDRLLGASRTVPVRQTLLLVALICITVAHCFAQTANAPLRKPPMGYELYSWHGPNGSWNFSVLPSPSGVNIPAEAVFNKKFLLRGVKELNKELSRLPAGATIYWFDRILGNGPKTKETERLSYPPANIIDQVRQTAGTLHVEVQVLRNNR